MNRRDFLKINVALFASVKTGAIWAAKTTGADSQRYSLTSFIEIASDNSISLWINQQEMGQGVRTSIAQLICEELDVDPGLVALKQAPAHPDRYGRLLTGGSGAMRRSWLSMRKAGAAAREVLIRAAAQKLGKPITQFSTRNGFVIHTRSDLRLSYGELVATANKLPLLADPVLKSKEDFTLVGKSLPGLDNKSIVSGNMKFGADFKLPGMRYAALIRSPTLKGKVKTFSAATGLLAKDIEVYSQDNLPLTEDMPQTRAALVVVGTNTWSVSKAKQSIEVEWETGQVHHRDSQQVKTELMKLSEKPGVVTRQSGDTWNGNDASLAAQYYTPMQYQAQLEPMVCTAVVKESGCQVWAPVQWPHFIQKSVASFLSLPLEKVEIFPMRMGGSFGRKYCDDFVIECVSVAKKYAGVPIQLQWSREDDMQAGGPQIPCAHKLVAKLNDGRISHWMHRLVQASPTVSEPQSDAWQADQGQVPMPYEIKNVQCQYNVIPFDMDTTAHRAVFYPTNAFAINSFMDELAVLDGSDPTDFHLRHLKQDKELVFAEWQKDLPSHLAFKTSRLKGVVKTLKSIVPDKMADQGRGFALQRAMFSYVAAFVDVKMIDGKLKITDVYVAIDCGFVINPEGARAQVEGSIIWGLSTALYEEMTLNEGVIEQTNYHQYPLFRMSDTPNIHIEFVDSHYDPTGLGEPVVTLMAAALTNGIFNLTGQRIRTLPVKNYLKS